MKKYLLGYDIGSSSVKASLVEAETGRCTASAQYPASEAPIRSLRPGWAEQDPEDWWSYLVQATRTLLSRVARNPGNEIAAIGISYQMHGLVCLDREGRPLRPSIIWCDSRAVPYGEAAFRKLGADRCLGHLLNAPGNFTAAKLAWVKENEPDLYARIHQIMLPGDYIALRLSGEACTTVSGLSEGMFWDFPADAPAGFLLDAFGFDPVLLPPVKPTFSVQGTVSASAAAELGLSPGIPVSYRAGDQPNNALSLGVLEPGEVAATAGTSGVVYGVNGTVAFDPQSRVNIFAHVNHTAADPRLGVLLCINGTGILNSWIRRNAVPVGTTYPQMNEVAASLPIGCDGVGILPFGNGAERMLGNRQAGCRIFGLDFNRHGWQHLVRAAQEGIVFSFRYGLGIMQEMGLHVDTIRAGKANMFLSPVFREALSGVTGARIELFDTDGAAGAAKGAGVGIGLYASPKEALSSLERLDVVEPARQDAYAEAYAEAYARWEAELLKTL